MIKNAMHRKNGGVITFYGGKPGNSDKRYRRGNGLSHIVAKHGIKVQNKISTNGSIRRLVRQA